jgi:alpha-1,2-mannosyltransferase
MSQAPMSRAAARTGQPAEGRSLGPRRLRLTPISWVIVATTALALGLRMWQLSSPGHLTGVTEYDDGVYLGAALRLVHGVMPYRDFVLVQPPGLILLMTPVAALAKWTGTDGAMAVGRVLTACAGAAAVPVAGRLVRHRGLLAVLITCGLLAVYPDAIAASVTVLQEPWLVLCCLAGTVAVFDGDQVTFNWKRLAWGGAAFGFAGAIKVWAVIPVLVIVALAVRRPRRAAVFLGGTAAGFLVPVLPFAAASPGTFYKGVIVAQIVRVDDARVSAWTRLTSLTGLDSLSPVSHQWVLIASIAIAALAVLAFAGGWIVTRRPPPALDWFALVTAAGVVAAFMWPADFYYHYSDFLAPFLALCLGLPVARLMAGLEQAGWRPAGDGRAWRAATAVTVAAIAAMAVSQVYHEGRARASVHEFAALHRVIPPGACVLTDEVSYTIAADRFFSTVPGCSQVVDGEGTDLALSRGKNGVTGAGRVPAVQAVWDHALRAAQYVWLSSKMDSVEARRIAWTPALRAYFFSHFRPVQGPGLPDNLYRRAGQP